MWLACHVPLAGPIVIVSPGEGCPLNEAVAVFGVDVVTQQFVTCSTGRISVKLNCPEPTKFSCECGKAS